MLPRREKFERKQLDCLFSLVISVSLYLLEVNDEIEQKWLLASIALAIALDKVYPGERHLRRNFG